MRLSSRAASVLTPPVRSSACSRMRRSMASRWACRSRPASGSAVAASAATAGCASRTRRRQDARLDHLALAQRHRPLHDVGELADVARVGVGGEEPLGLGREAHQRLAELRGEALEEVAEEQRDVLAPLAQGRHADLDDVEAVVEVLAEAARLHLLAEVAVGGGDDARRRRRCRRCRRRGGSSAPGGPAGASPAPAAAARRPRRGRASPCRPPRRGRASARWRR